MANPLLLLWRLLGADDDRRPPRRRMPFASAKQASATIFLVLRRMRAPLIVLIVIFAVSTFGLTLVPGQDDAGRPWRMTFFDAFYFMSYTASTIGFGEIPYTFTSAQRLWVTFSIYLTVIGWAYAIGSLLSLVNDRGFRQALALQHFSRKVQRLREPFLLIAGYGRTGELLARSFDLLGRRLVVIDVDGGRIDDLDLDAYRADVPGLAGDAGDPGHLGLAGLGHPCCEGVLALTDDDEANLAVTQTVALLRPELPVVARTTSPSITDRMRSFGTPTVVNAFDRFGDHLRVALRAPASHQLITWLESGPGAALPARGAPPREGHWVVCGFGRFGRGLVEDLRGEGLDVAIIDPDPSATGDPDLITGYGYEPSVLVQAGVAEAAGVVAGTDNDTTNLSLVAAARRLNPHLFVAARQNRSTSAPLFDAVEIDSLLVPAEVVAREVYAQLSTPLLWRFLQEVPQRSDAWAAGMVDRLTRLSGTHLEALWKVRLTPDEAPALGCWLDSGEAHLGDLMRSPEDRDDPLHAVALLLMRGEEWEVAPGPDTVLVPGDELLLVGWPSARRSLDTTLVVDAVREYVVTGRRVPSSWIWRRLSGTAPAR